MGNANSAAGNIKPKSRKIFEEQSYEKVTKDFHMSKRGNTFLSSKYQCFGAKFL